MHCKNLFFLLLIFSINAFSFEEGFAKNKSIDICLLYTSDAADE